MVQRLRVPGIRGSICVSVDYVARCRVVEGGVVECPQCVAFVFHGFLFSLLRPLRLHHSTLGIRSCISSTG
jgi:hypothetical protein